MESHYVMGMALAKHANVAEAHHCRGTILLEFGRCEEAIGALDRAIELGREARVSILGGGRRCSCAVGARRQSGSTGAESR